MHLNLLLTTACTVLVFQYCSGKVVLSDDGGYTNVFFTFSPAIAPSNDSVNVIENLMTIVKESSDFLYKATRSNTFLEEVNIIVPSDWSSVLSKQTRVQSRKSNFYYKMQDASVRIDVENPLHGNHPYVHQPTLCGAGGRYIHYTSTYLMNFLDTDKYGNYTGVFAHNWSRLRYGVFEEYGYHGDDIYNEFFNDGSGGVKPTFCSNIPLKGTFVKSGNSKPCPSKTVKNLTDENCHFHWENYNMTSSLMYLTNTSFIETFCDSNENEHIVTAPTKQNFLCDFQDTWDIITKSADFKRIKKSSKKDITVNVIVNKVANSNFAFVFDYSKNMLADDKYKILYLALNNFDTMNKNGQKHIEYIACTDGKADVRALASLLQLPDPDTAKACLSCGIRKSNSDVIILITDGIINVAERNSIKKELRGKEVHLDVILYPLPADADASWWIALANKNNVNLYTIQTKDDARHNIETFYKLFLKIFDQSGPHHEFLDFKPSANGSLISYHGSFMTKSRSNVALTCVGNQQFYFELYCPATKLDLRTTAKGPTPYYDKYAVLTSPNLDGNFSYVLNTTSDSCFLYVKKFENRNLIMNSWVNSNNGRIELINGGIIIYAEVFSQNYQAIIRANVSASITVWSKSQSVISEMTVALLDDGNGDPDVTLNDGVYSAYIKYPLHTGYYQIVTTIQVTKDTAVNLFKNNDITRRCCGSFVPLSNTEKIKPFKQEIPLSLLYLENDPGVVTFPSRIGNLKCKQDKSKSGNTSVHKINLTWTAPGAVLTTGKVRSYDIRTSTSRKQLITAFENCTQIVIDMDQNFSPSEPFKPECVAISLNTSGVHFFAIRAMNSHMKFGKLSNIAEVNIMVANTETTPDDNLWSSGFIITVVGLCLLVVMALAIFIFFIARYRKNKRKKQETEGDKKDEEGVAEPKQQNRSSQIYSVRDTLKFFNTPERSSKNQADDDNVYVDPESLQRSYDNPVLDKSNPDDLNMSQSPEYATARKSFRRITLV